MTQSDPKKISGKTWIMMHLDNMRATGRVYGPELLHRVCGAALCEGRYTEKEWDSLFEMATESGHSMDEVEKFR